MFTQFIRGFGLTARSVADLIIAASYGGVISSGRSPGHESASFLHRTTAGRIAKNLPTGFGLRGSRFRGLPVRVPLPRIFPRGCRLLLRHLLTLVIVTDVIAGPAGDLHALIAIGLEAEIAHERADPSRLRFQRIECIDARELH